MSDEAASVPDSETGNVIRLQAPPAGARGKRLSQWLSKQTWRDIPYDETQELQSLVLRTLHRDRSHPGLQDGNKVLWKAHGKRGLLTGDKNWNSPDAFRFGVAMSPSNRGDGDNAAPMNLELRVQSPRRLLKTAQNALTDYLHEVFGDNIPVRFTGPVRLLEGFSWFGPSALKIGADVAAENGMEGPITCFVRKGDDEVVYALVCGHVVGTNGSIPTGKTVNCPSGLVRGRDSHLLGEIVFVQYPETNPKSFADLDMDVGLVKVNETRVPRKTGELNEIPGRNADLIEVKGLTPDDIRTTNLDKTPAATPMKSGIVGPKASFVTANDVGDFVMVENCFEIYGQDNLPFGMPGDSGALLVDSQNRGRATMIAAAMNTAPKIQDEWDNPGYIYSLSEPFDALKLTLI